MLKNYILALRKRNSNLLLLLMKKWKEGKKQHVVSFAIMLFFLLSFHHGIALGATYYDLYDNHDQLSADPDYLAAHRATFETAITQLTSFATSSILDTWQGIFVMESGEVIGVSGRTSPEIVGSIHNLTTGATLRSIDPVFYSGGAGTSAGTMVVASNVSGSDVVDEFNSAGTFVRSLYTGSLIRDVKVVPKARSGETADRIFIFEEISATQTRIRTALIPAIGAIAATTTVLTTSGWLTGSDNIVNFRPGGATNPWEFLLFPFDDASLVGDYRGPYRLETNTAGLSADTAVDQTFKYLNTLGLYGTAAGSFVTKGGDIVLNDFLAFTGTSLLTDILWLTAAASVGSVSSYLLDAIDITSRSSPSYLGTSHVHSKTGVPPSSYGGAVTTPNIVPEIPSGFFGIFVLLMSGLILRFKRFFCRPA